MSVGQLERYFLVFWWLFDFKTVIWYSDLVYDFQDFSLQYNNYNLPVIWLEAWYIFQKIIFENSSMDVSENK